jgi:hypothetical protein
VLVRDEGLPGDTAPELKHVRRHASSIRPLSHGVISRFTVSEVFDPLILSRESFHVNPFGQV